MTIDELPSWVRFLIENPEFTLGMTIIWMSWMAFCGGALILIVWQIYKRMPVQSNELQPKNASELYLKRIADKYADDKQREATQQEKKESNPFA